MDLELVESLVVRELSTVKRNIEVPDYVAQRLPAYPASGFDCVTRCLSIFKDIDDVPVLVYLMYVDEFGFDAAEPNRLRAYLSCMDSSHFLEPAVSQLVLKTYMKFLKKRNYRSLSIWSAAGYREIFPDRPDSYEEPSEIKLSEWYGDVLDLAQQDGDIRGVSDCITELEIYRELPFFESDYLSGRLNMCSVT